MNWLDQYLHFTKEHESQDYWHKWCAFSCIASVLARRVWTKVGFEVVYPNFYIILVSPSGAARKGAALKVALNVMDMAKRKEMIQMIAEVITYREIHDALERSKTDIKINGSHYTYMAATAVSSELEAFIRLEDRNMVVTLTKLYDADNDYRYHTRGAGKVDLENVCLNILGGTVPDYIKKAEKSGAWVGTGFAARCILLFAKSRRFNKMSPTIDKDAQMYLADGLCKMGALKGEVFFENSAREYYDDWYENKMITPKNAIPQMLPFYERKQVHVKKITMIRAAMDTLQGGEFKINIGHVKKAIQDVADVEPYMAAVFKGVGLSDEYAVLESICCQLEEAKDGQGEYLWVSKSEIFHKHIADATPQVIQTTLDTIIGNLRVGETKMMKGMQWYKLYESAKAYERKKDG